MTKRKRAEANRERSAYEQQLLEDVIDGLPPLAFFGAMQELHGSRRVMELVGWAVVWGLLGVESLRDMRQRYEEAGLTKSSAYRAAADFKKFADFLLLRYGREFEMKEILAGLTGGLPISENIVL